MEEGRFAGFLAGATAIAIAVASCGQVIDGKSGSNGGDAGAGPGRSVDAGTGFVCSDAPASPGCTPGDGRCAVETACMVGTCAVASGTCAYVPAPAGTPCLESGGTACDGKGSCACAGNGCLAAGQVLWAETFPAYGLLPAPVAVDAEGNIILAGAFPYALDLGESQLFATGDEDAYIAKLDRRGKVLWSKRFGGTFQTQAQALVHAVAIDAAGDIALAGQLFGSVDFGGGPVVDRGQQSVVFVATFDRDGNPKWSASFGDETNGLGIAAGAAFDDAGNLVLVGFFEGTLDFGEGPIVVGGGGLDGFVAKLDRAGHALWSRQGGPIGAASNNLIWAVATGVSGDIFITGRLMGDTFLGCTAATSMGTPESDWGFVARLDGEGEVEWITGAEGASGVAVDPSGRATVSGGSSVGSGAQKLFFPAMYGFEASGRPSWSLLAPRGLPSAPVGSGWEPGFGPVAVTRWGRPVAVGALEGVLDLGSATVSGTGMPSLLFASLDGFGGVRAAFSSSGSNGGVYSSGVAVDPSSGLAVVDGVLSGGVDLGGMKLRGRTESLFVAGINP